MKFGNGGEGGHIQLTWAIILTNICRMLHHLIVHYNQDKLQHTTHHQKEMSLGTLPVAVHLAYFQSFGVSFLASWGEVCHLPPIAHLNPFQPLIIASAVWQKC